MEETDFRAINNKRSVREAMKSDVLQKLVHRAVWICYVVEERPETSRTQQTMTIIMKNKYTIYYIYVQNELHIIINQSPHHLFLMLKTNTHGAVEISKVSSERINAFLLDLLNKRLDLRCNGLGVKAKVLVRLLAG